MTEICDRIDRAIYRLHRADYMVLNVKDLGELAAAEDRNTTVDGDRVTAYRGVKVMEGQAFDHSFVQGIGRRAQPVRSPLD